MSSASGQTPDEQIASPDAAQDELLDALLQRMRGKSDFPAL